MLGHYTFTRTLRLWATRRRFAEGITLLLLPMPYQLRWNLLVAVPLRTCLSQLGY